MASLDPSSDLWLFQSDVPPTIQEGPQEPACLFRIFLLVQEVIHPKSPYPHLPKGELQMVTP